MDSNIPVSNVSEHTYDLSSARVRICVICGLRHTIFRLGLGGDVDVSVCFGSMSVSAGNLTA